MRFWLIESTYMNQGTEKAFADSDCYGHTYYIPRSQVKIVERVQPVSEYDVAKLVIDIPDWIIRKNNIPVFKMTALGLIR